MNFRITALVALTALGAPAAALAERPAHAGPAFVVTGVDVSGLDLDDGRLAGPVTLDPISANRHARNVLRISREKVRGDDTIRMGRDGDDVVIRYHGLERGDTLQPTDVVKIIGKASPSGAVDIRRITVTRPAPADG